MDQHLGIPALGVSPATIDDLDVVVEVLTAAFLDDPLMRWLFPDDRTRAARLTTMWTYLARGVYLPAGGCTVLRRPAASEGVVAAALWLPTGSESEESLSEREGTQFVHDMDGEVERLAVMSEVMREQHPVEPAWYLLAAGVLPEHWGRGAGTELLSATLEQLDRVGEAAYLEATSPRSRVLYHRLGFADRDTLDIPDAPPVWGMWRPSA